MQKQRKLNATESDFKSFKINLSTPTYLPTQFVIREVENTLLLTQKERKNFEMKVLNEFLPREMKRQ